MLLCQQYCVSITKNEVLLFYSLLLLFQRIHMQSISYVQISLLCIAFVKIANIYLESIFCSEIYITTGFIKFYFWYSKALTNSLDWLQTYCYITTQMKEV